MHSKAVGKRISWTNCALLALLDVREVLDLLRKCGEQAVFVLGHRGYYQRFGFQSDLAARFESLYAGDSFFALELEAGVLDRKSGAVSFASAFSAFE